MENIKTANEVTFKYQNNQADFISYDAPPLDFSFKNIHHLSQLKDIEPRKGTKKTSINEDFKNNNKKEEKEEHSGLDGEDEHRSDKKKNQAIKLLPQNKVSDIVSTMVNNSALKNISSKAKQELEKKKKKAVHVKLVCASLMLGYNKIRELSGLDSILNSVMESPFNLQWIDLSHNYLVSLDYDFQHFPHLKTLYLHCNYFFDLAELQKLKHLSQLKTATIHGNPFAAIPNFRILAISILQGLKKLDSVLISKKERDNAIFIRSQTKKYPLPKNPAVPPVEKKEEEDEEEKE